MKKTTVERFQRQIAPRSVPKWPVEFGLMPFLPFFKILFENMGPFSAPREIADRSKIARLRDNSDFDPRKMPSGRGFGKNMKIWWKNDAKMEGFWWLGTTFGVILFAYFTLFRFSKRIEKSMPKGRRKVVIFGPKCDLRRSRVDLSDVFWRFWKIRKIDDFLMSLWTWKSR